MQLRYLASSTPHITTLNLGLIAVNPQPADVAALIVIYNLATRYRLWSGEVGYVRVKIVRDLKKKIKHPFECLATRHYCSNYVINRLDGFQLENTKCCYLPNYNYKYNLKKEELRISFLQLLLIFMHHTYLTYPKLARLRVPVRVLLP